MKEILWEQYLYKRESKMKLKNSLAEGMISNLIMRLAGASQEDLPTKEEVTAAKELGTWFKKNKNKKVVANGKEQSVEDWLDNL
jgi:hypothetical protein